MPRKRVTQVFPFLIPLRKFERKKLFYLKMQHDGNKYAHRISENLLPNTVFSAASLMLNENSGFDIQYQLNKVFNLKLASKKINKVIIEPNETFSFFQLVRYADRYEKYKDGLNLIDGKISGSYGGGLCQLSSLLFWMFLHTPLTVTERHGHPVEFFPSTNEELPCGTDATVTEGWLDLKARNDTDNTFQIEISFDDKFIFGRILAAQPVNTEYRIFNSDVTYISESKKIYQLASVCRLSTDKCTQKAASEQLYVNRCEIGYKHPDNIEIKERGVKNE